MANNRMTQGMRHLRARLERSAGVFADGFAGDDGSQLFANVPVVPLSYSKLVRQENETPSSVRVHAWGISVARVVAEMSEGDFLDIDGKRYRLQKDDATQQLWTYHGEHELLRVYFSVLWDKG